ncbi:ER membrane protein complex subunit 7 [Lingula anatina]|uniref:ER membrane protein complex subunit 7 n=1 Tax=Lingula anatina TaxID=7574 RepID=A0A1S3JIE3_LINAN|nr:ER membrane protein complex subunit 7 [Lingula anatina]|eukprot:XP_013410180.1 ER membrane protein complex subunit 7 [Lingula anatina]
MEVFDRSSWSSYLTSWLYLLVVTLLILVQCWAEDVVNNQKFKIDGKVTIPSNVEREWVSSTRVTVDGGQYIGFLKSDGTFSVHLPSGSYVLEVLNPNHVFEPVRVDVTSKGKIRGRRVNNVQSSQVQQVPYPLRFKAKGKASYYMPREQWRVTDLLMNPMVLMMVLPLIFIVILPKLVNTNDPETQKEMANQMNFLKPNNQLPDLSEALAGFFGGGSSSKKTTKSKSKKLKSQ